MAQKITPYLWFDQDSEEAMNLYTKLFNENPTGKKADSKILSITKYPENIPGMEGMAGKVLNATFSLEGQEFMALDGGPQFKFNESFSLFVDCKTQEEVDYFWNNLIADGGEESMCGWLKDKFGMSWQIIPEALGRLMSDSDQQKVGRVMQCMLKMKKIVVKDLEEAYNSN